MKTQTIRGMLKLFGSGIQLLVTRVIPEEAGISTSLVEASTVIAVGLTLVAAVGVTVTDLTGEAKITRATSELNVIAQAIITHEADTSEFPVRGIPNQSVTIPFRAGQTAMACMRSGEDATRDPNFEASKGICEAAPGFLPLAATDTPETTKGAFINNHLFFDKFLDLSLGYTVGDPNNGTPARAWRKNLNSSSKADPWGQNYIILSRGFVDNTPAVNGNPRIPWILSAGPDGVINTGEQDFKLQEDDIGIQGEFRD